MKDLKIYVVVASVLMVIYLVAEYNRPKPVDWTETYSNTDEMPFGTLILYERLADIFPGAGVTSFQKTPSEVIRGEGLTNNTYMIISDAVDCNEDDFAALTDYVSKGNNVFIAAADLSGVLEDKLKVHISSELAKNGQTFIDFKNEALGSTHYIFDRKITEGYFSDYDTTKTIVLGSNGYNHASYIKIPKGKGAFYLNANPLMFSNYSLVKTQGADYAEKALAYVKVQHGIVWDEFYSQGSAGGDSSMRVFLQHAPLRWAFYLVFFSLLVFVVYQSKRRQRIIPVILPLANSSVDFVTVVGQVYYEQHNNSNVAQKKVNYFLDYIRSRHNLNTSVHNKSFLDTLAKKSGADRLLIEEIFYHIGLIQNNQPVSDNELLNFNQKIEQFYSLPS